MSESSSGLFPDTIALQFSSWDVGRLEATDIETAYSGREVRRARFATGGYRFFSGSTAPLSQTDSQSLRDFLRARRGRLQAFYIFQPDVESYSDEAAGTVSGSATFIIPFKTSTLTTVKVGGVSKVFTVTAGAGTNGEDRVNFTGGSQTGAVTITGTARARVLVRSDEDSYQHNIMLTPDYRAIWQLKFKEVI